MSKLQRITINLSKIKGKIIFITSETDEKNKELEAKLILDLEQKINSFSYIRAHLGLKS